MKNQTPILSVAAVREWEAAAAATGHSYERMMELAGQGVARAALRYGVLKGRRVLVLVGPGNNGGDGLVAARCLAEAGAQVTAYLVAPCKQESKKMLERAEKRGVIIVTRETDPEGVELRRLCARTEVLIDALLGTGAHPPLRSGIATILQDVSTTLAHNDERQPLRALTVPPQIAPPQPLIIAVDGPSGMDFDTGAADPLTLKAHISVTFGAPKIGHFHFPAAEFCGDLFVADIGIPESVPPPAAWGRILTAEVIRDWLPSRPANAHKGIFGRALIVAGSSNYPGAAALAALAAIKAGAGLVTLGIPGALQAAIVPLVPEVTYLSLSNALGAITENAVTDLEETLPNASALLIGPGLGQAPETVTFIQRLLGTRLERRQAGFTTENTSANRTSRPPAALPPLIVDADGLNILSALPEWPQLLPPGSILTPHPGEMRRLMGQEKAAPEAERQELARQYAEEWGQVVVLKGAFTVIAAPDGRAVISPFANAGLASAGMGDVLAGTIIALRAQGLNAFEAAATGVYLHGLAGELLREQSGDAGLAASDVARSLPEVLWRLKRGA
ncbi:MAG: NAD(P)H-hydrate dehydratase [Anaerolineae bacterium]|nr:NAD(P)H-hydrate dehydratase [Anaerolineae bacterium]